MRTTTSDLPARAVDPLVAAEELFRWMQYDEGEDVPLTALVACVAFEHGVALPVAGREVARCLRLAGLDGLPLRGTRVPPVTVTRVLTLAEPAA